jgi:dienelactone hydrolase
MGGTFVLDLASLHAGLVTVAYYGFPVPPATVVSPPPRPIDLVGTLRGPVLAFWGDQDEAVGMTHIREYARLASAANPRFEHEIVPNLGHGFLGSSHLEEIDDPGGATWHRALAHLRNHLMND